VLPNESSHEKGKSLFCYLKGNWLFNEEETSKSTEFKYKNKTSGKN
jgi:hypothetical protein